MNDERFEEHLEAWRVNTLSMVAEIDMLKQALREIAGMEAYSLLATVARRALAASKMRDWPHG